jgi:hypothetical protein
MLQKILFDSMGQGREELDAHSRPGTAAFLPVPDNKGCNLHFKAAVDGKYHLDVRAYRGRGLRIDKHAVHGNVPAAGNQVVTRMDEIHPEVNRKTLDYPSVAGCHPFAPSTGTFPGWRNAPEKIITLLPEKNVDRLFCCKAC